MPGQNKETSTESEEKEDTSGTTEKSGSGVRICPPILPLAPVDS
jgi:hypothetical protein